MVYIVRMHLGIGIPYIRVYATRRAEVFQISRQKFGGVDYVYSARNIPI